MGGLLIRNGRISRYQATNLSKKYRLGTIGMTSLREDLSRWWNRGENEITDGGSTQAGIEHSA